MLSLYLPFFYDSSDAFTAPHSDLVLTNNPEYGSYFDLIQDYDEVVSAEPFEQTSTSIRFIVESECENITGVFVDGVAYNLGYQPLQPGQFFYDTTAQIILVVPLIGQNINANSIVNYRCANSGQLIPSTQICDRTIIPLFQKWNVNTAEISVDYNFNSEPSISEINFFVCRDELFAVRTELCNGTEFAAFNNRWVINKLSMVYLRNSDRIGVNIQAVHWLAARGNPNKSPLDIPFKLANSSSDSATSNSTSSATFVSFRTLSDYCNLAGINLTGGDVTIGVPESTTDEDTVTIRELISEHPIKTHSFVHYNKDGIELRRWGITRLHSLSDREIKSDFVVSANGHGSCEGGVKLHTEYEKVEIELDFDSTVTSLSSADDAGTIGTPGGSIDNDKIGYTVRWVFENCVNFSDLVTPREYIGNRSRSPSRDILRSPTINFDSGGKAKSGTKIEEQNGTIVAETRYEYGYAFTTEDVYDVLISNETLNYKFTGSSPAAYFTEVSKTSTKYFYSGDGYLTSKVTSGSRLARLKQETENLEAIKLKAQIEQLTTPNDSLNNQLESYRFIENLPISDVTEYELENFSDYFSDTPSGAFPPKFIAKKSRLSESKIIRENPENTETITYPKVITGLYKQDVMTTTITNPYFPYKHETRTIQSNNEGEYFKNAIATSGAVQSNGKPGIAPRIDTSPDPLITIRINRNSDKYEGGTFTLNSANLGVNDAAPTTTISYSGIDDPNVAAAIAETELSITNTLNALTVSGDIFYKEGLEVGDRILYKGLAHVVTAITDSRYVNHQHFTSKEFQITIGRLLTPKLSLTTGEFLSSDIETDQQKCCVDELSALGLGGAEDFN